MTALELISLTNQILFVGLFGAVLLHALRRPTRASFNTALLFGAIAGVVAISRVADWLGVAGEPAVTATILVLLNAAPFAMLRLVDDFSGSPRWAQVAGTIAFILASGFVLVSSLSVSVFDRVAPVVLLVTVGFFLAVGGYAALAFARDGLRTHGITRRRMIAVATGATLFIGAIVVIFVGLLLEPLLPAFSIIGQLAALAAVGAFFIGFTPPRWVRRAWREPDLRGFLEQSVRLAGVTDDHAALAELQGAAAAAFGAPGAAIGLADESGSVLRYAELDGSWVEYPSHMFIAGRAFREQRRMVVLDATRADPEHAADYERAGARTVISAPITIENRRIGVLALYADRAPIFVEDDLWLLELLASQSAVLLEARTLTAHASQLRAREEAALLKEEFLSAAAHDLRTPLTVVLGQAELMERRAARDPTAPVDGVGLARIVREARRLRDLVGDLLDVQRLEDGRAVIDLAPADLCEVVESIRDRHAGNGVSVGVKCPPAPLVSSVDRPRIEQVLDNLVDNALKYGPGDSSPEIELGASDGLARLAVVDHGPGIPGSDRERIFERFYRASNAHGVTDTGLGLGLYICRRIIDEHEGRIWYEETPGGGSTFVVTLPLERVTDGAPGEDRTARSEWSSPIPGQAVADA